MEPKQIIKQMIDFNRASFNNNYDMLVMIQDHAERMTGCFLRQSGWFPEEGKNILTEWSKACKKGQEEMKKHIHTGLNKIEEIFPAPSPQAVSDQAENGRPVKLQ